MITIILMDVSLIKISSPSKKNICYYINMFMKNEFSNRLVQVSLFAGIVYYITAYPIVFEKARKYFPIKFKKTHHLLIFHTFVFAVLMYVLTYFVFDPLVKVVEGKDDESAEVIDSQGIYMCNDATKQIIEFITPSEGVRNCNGTITTITAGVNNPRTNTITCPSGYNIAEDKKSPMTVLCSKN